MYLFISVFLAIFVLNILGFFLAYLFKTDKFTDISYSLSFICGVILSLKLFQNFSVSHLIISGMVIVWAVRLGIYLYSRIHKMKSDKRFDAMRNSFWRFGSFWILQAFSVCILILPVAFMLSEEDLHVGAFQYLGMLIFIGGFFIESLADYQKNVFKNKHPYELLTNGLFGIVRYPNYLGEILVWFGIFIFGITIYEGVGWSSIISPLWIYVLLRYISGIPLVEKQRKLVYGHKIDYKNYLQKTGMLIPFLH